MTSKSAHIALVAIVCTLSTAATALAQRAIVVSGLDGTKASVSLGDLPRKTLHTADAAGIKTTHEGVAMSDVLAKAGIPMGAALRGKALARVVIATAADGYQVAYSIAEIDADFSDQIILIVDTRNGKPLLADSGPLQIVVPQDKRAARWVRQVIQLEVRQLP